MKRKECECECYCHKQNGPDSHLYKIFNCNHCLAITKTEVNQEGFCKRCDRYFVNYDPNHACFGEFLEIIEKTDI